MRSVHKAGRTGGKSEKLKVNTRTVGVLQNFKITVVLEIKFHWYIVLKVT